MSMTRWIFRTGKKAGQPAKQLVQWVFPQVWAAIAALCAALTAAVLHIGAEEFAGGSFFESTPFIIVLGASGLACVAVAVASFFFSEMRPAALWLAVGTLVVCTAAWVVPLALAMSSLLVLFFGADALISLVKHFVFKQPVARAFLGRK
jgi:hypothetical protein